MADDRLRAVERLVAAGELEPRAALVMRDRVRGEPLLPVLACDDLHGSGWGCQGGPGCLGWTGREPWAGALPSGECVLTPWRNVAVTACAPQRYDRAVLRRELVTGARVLVGDRPCERCGGWGWEEEPADEEATCGTCNGTGSAGDEWCSSCGGAGRWLAATKTPCSACRGTGAGS